MNNYGLIYIIDDDELNNMLNRQFLNFSLPRTTVVSFVDALDLLKNLVKGRIEVPDLILLDISMPELSGWEFLDYCEKYQIKCEKLVLSSSLHFDDIARANNYSDVRGYITKPLSREKIKHYIIDRKETPIELD